jgi:LysM repeat protein
VPQPDELRRYAAPAAFLLAVTVAVVLVRAGLEHGTSSPETTTSTSVRKPTTSRQVVTTTTRKATHTTRARTKVYWTVKAGDTFGVISAGTGVPVATIERLNPKASSTTLFIGERIRIK